MFTYILILNVQLYLKSNLNMTIESQYMTSYLMSKVMFVLYTIMSEILSTYSNRKLIYNFLFDGFNIFALWVTVWELLTFKIVWPWPAQWVNGNCHYTYRKPICSFLFDTNSKICLIFHPLWENHNIYMNVSNALDLNI